MRGVTNNNMAFTEQQQVRKIMIMVIVMVVIKVMMVMVKVVMMMVIMVMMVMVTVVMMVVMVMMVMVTNTIYDAQARQTALSPRELPSTSNRDPALDNSIKQEPLPSPPGGI